MSKLTLDDAIKHCLDIADGQDKCAEISVSEHAKERISQCAADHRQLAKWLTELKEAKRLLKAAVDDINYYVDCYEAHCDECCCDHDNHCHWKHEAEALALIGKDIDVPASAGDTNVGGKIASWISCKDRLPSENTLVLCYARSTTGEGNGYFLGAIAHGEFWFLKVNDIGHVSCPVLHWEVTHWQPLPEPPEIGGADNENS